MLNFSLGNSKKKYMHDMSYTINTTSDFGSFQPILCQYLSPNDTAKMVDFRQLVRNAVMPSPTFGDIKCINDFTFVPCSDIFPAFEALISHQMVATDNRKYIPNAVPCVSSSQLLAILCGEKYSKVCAFSVSGSDSKRKLVNNTAVTLQSVNLWLKDVVASYSPNKSTGADGRHSTLNIDTPVFPSIKCKPVNGGFSPASADFRFTANGVSSNVMFCVRLNARGRRLYKIFKGLGYSLDVVNSNPVSALPLFAFFKAYFDKYAPTREIDWQSTDAFECIQGIFNRGVIDILYDNEVGRKFVSFVDSLADCWYSYKDDFFSANFASPNSNVGVDSLPNVPQTNIGNYENLPSIKTNEPITNVAVQTLSRLTKFLNKNSLIGKRVSEYIRVHFGAAVADSLYKVSYNVATLTTDVKLDDTYSQADTAVFSNIGGSGQPLGARAGIGQGFSSNSFTFQADRFGFLIGMCAIYPNSGYCQGDDPQLYMTSRYTFPSAEFDALGYELTPLATIYDNANIAYDGRRLLTGQSFGYVPRYSGLKYKKNLLNGCMSLGSTSDSFKGFYLDRLLVEQADIIRPTSGDDYNMTFKTGQIPLASPLWKRILQFPQLGYFNRIFLNQGEIINGDRGSIYVRQVDDVIDDNFTVQCMCDLKISNSLKPLGMSFDTYDEEVDNNSTTINNV